MTEFLLENLYQAIKNMVIASDAAQPCERLNSFVIINDKFDFEKDFVAGKKINPYYFSRASGKIAYPVLAFSEVSDILGDYKNEKFRKFCHRFEVGILDQVKEKCTNCKPCEKRKEDEVYRDTAKLLYNILNDVSSIKAWIAQPDDVEVFAPKTLMDAYVLSGAYTSYKEVPKLSSVMNFNFKERNTTIDFRKIKLQKSNLIGYFAIITFCEVCPPGSSAYKIREVTNQEDCC